MTFHRTGADTPRGAVLTDACSARGPQPQAAREELIDVARRDLAAGQSAFAPVPGRELFYSDCDENRAVAGELLGAMARLSRLLADRHSISVPIEMLYATLRCS